MPEFVMHDPATGEDYVVGNAADRARLESRGYKDVTDETTNPASADAPAAIGPDSAATTGDQADDIASAATTPTNTKPKANRASATSKDSTS